jgi:predicted HTH transcriptional regulator
MAIGRDAALRAIRNLHEERDKEFAESQPFDVLKWKLITTSMAMANLRDGGSIIIGISQRDPHFAPTGMSEAHLNGYDPDNVIAAINKYAKPPIPLAVYKLEEAGRAFLVIDAAPFKRTPIMCSKGPPDDSGQKFKAGDIFARTLDRISTSRIVDLDLMELASENRAAEIVATAQRIGLRLPSTDIESFARERADFGDLGDEV